jgi:hypothetical protein
MDFKNYYKRTEIENIYWEIFKETSGYKNYCLGVAQGMYFIYDLIKKHKYKISSNEDWIKIIETVANEDEKIGEYFRRISGSNS